MLNKHKIYFILFVLPFLFSSSAFAQSNPMKVKPGIDVLMDTDFALLAHKRVGLITNPTGLNTTLKSSIDILHESPVVNLVALFGPEHGVRGDYSAGEKVRFRLDEKTGIPVHSLYGKTRKPNAEMLRNIDVLVYDIQDIGCRSYTYISTMGLAMEAAAENDIDFVVLDRPNPLGGIKIEGPIAEKDYFSLVGAYPIPYVYGLTCGELARMINEENWLKNGQKCRLEVVKMEAWTRDMHFEDTGLQWVPSSPHIPHASTIPYYVASGVLGELGVINIGVGYTLPFRLFGFEDLESYLLLDQMTHIDKTALIFRPLSYKPYYGKWANKYLKGFEIHILNQDALNLMAIQFHFLEAFHKVYPEIDVLALSKDRHNMFDKVTGSSKIRELFFKNYKYEAIEKLMYKDVASFRKLSSKYYLY